MTFIPKFPTKLHQDTAQLISGYFLATAQVDGVLVVNSCARGQAVPESDLDFAILTKPNTTRSEITDLEGSWQIYSKNTPDIFKIQPIKPICTSARGHY